MAATTGKLLRLIEIYDEDRVWRVTFDTSWMPPAGEDHERSGATCHVRAVSAPHFDHTSNFEISADFVKQQDRRRQQKLDWFLHGIFRYYLAHSEEILATPNYLKEFGSKEEHYLLDLQGGTYLDRVEREIVDILFAITSVDVSRFSQAYLALPDPFEWRHTADALIHWPEVHSRCVAFYKAYQSVLQLDVPGAPDGVRRTNVLGHAALRAIAAARRPKASRRTAATEAPWPWDRGVSLRGLSVQNLRRFDALELSLHAPAGDKGQWIVLLGDNGTGKTTLLRAIALALLPDDVASAFVTQSSADAPLIRRPAGNGRHGHIMVKVGSETAEVSLTPANGRERLSIEQGLPERPLVFAYGCRRGSALGGREREADADPLRGATTLFDETASLLHAETWLRQIELEGAQRPERRDFAEAVKNTLVRLLPGSEPAGQEASDATRPKLIIEPKQVLIEWPGSPPVPLAGLSDGYLTTLGWTVDFIARWVEYAQRSGYPDLGPDFHRSMPCVVLIDELDLHLHPRWQRRIVADLRRAFPMTTFVATTHNPLTLLGTEPGEVHVIRERPDRTLEIVQNDLPKGIRADQVLTDDWFGLRSTMDDETMDLLDQHRRMLEEGVPAADPRRRALEAELRERTGRFAETPAARLAEELVAQHFQRHSGPVTDEDRAALRKLYAEHIARAGQGHAHSAGSDEP